MPCNAHSSLPRVNVTIRVKGKIGNWQSLLATNRSFILPFNTMPIYRFPTLVISQAHCYNISLRWPLHFHFESIYIHIYVCTGRYWYVRMCIFVCVLLCVYLCCKKKKLRIVAELHSRPARVISIICSKLEFEKSK